MLLNYINWTNKNMQLWKLGKTKLRLCHKINLSESAKSTVTMRCFESTFYSMNKNKHSFHHDMLLKEIKWIGVNSNIRFKTGQSGKWTYILQFQIKCTNQFWNGDKDPTMPSSNTCKINLSKKCQNVFAWIKIIPTCPIQY